MVPKASHDTGYTYQSTTHDKGGHGMQHWNATVASGLVAGVAMCSFFKNIRNYVPIFKTCVMWRQIVNFNVWQLQILQAETKNQGNRTNMGQEDFTALTGIAQLHIEFPSAHLSNCYGVLTFITFLLATSLLLILFSPPSLSHSLLIVVFLSVLLWTVEALSAKVMHRTGRSADRPTATGTPHCGRAAAGVRLPLTRLGHSPPVGGAKRAAANGNRAGGSHSPGTGWC